MGERFEQFIAVTGMKKGAFAEAIGIRSSQLSRYLKQDAQMPQRDVLVKLAALGCNLHWLLTGEGVMTADNEAGRALKRRLQGLGKEHEPTMLGDNSLDVMQMRVIRQEDLEKLEGLIATIKQTSM